MICLCLGWKYHNLRKCETSRKKQTGSDSLQGQRHLRKSDDICLTCAWDRIIVKNYWENVDIIII